jgi:sugar/nucleoside kinase (ribokinase family)
MTLLVVGSVAYDSVSTGAGTRDDALGGSATYFSIASSFFTNVSLVAVVGDDFLESDRNKLIQHGVNISNLEIANGNTFRWKGIYDNSDVNIRETLDTQLNVFEEFNPILNDKNKQSEFLFLANIDPALQLKTLNQMTTRPKIVALDTMNFWIDDHKQNLTAIIKQVDILFMDNKEIASFTGEINVIKAAKKITEMGPKTIVVKKGEHGVLMLNQGNIFVAPAIPIENVIDPTGAGDSFAGGFMGYLAKTNDMSNENFKRAIIAGSLMGSLAIEGFSIEKFASLTKQEIEKRFVQFVNTTSFEAKSLI